MKNKLINTLRRFLPFLGVIVALAIHLLIEDSDEHPEAEEAYYTWILYFFLATTFILGIVSTFVKKLKKGLEYSGAFWGGVGIVVAIIDIVIGKLALFPVLFFPKYDNILAQFFEGYEIILKCIWHSTKLLVTGFLYGAGFGFITGVLLGFNKKFNYWINPYIKLIGPIPATIWIPISLTIFPTTFGASVFIIALSVWFSVALMTSSAIQAVPKAYFEVSRTLGASSAFQIFRVGIPAAMPSIFLGVFYGIISAFLALMTAEMFGVKYGIGWYISWQKAMLVYSGVYAGIIVIAVYCMLILTLLFKLRDKILNWQKGTLKW
ncbi:ABC transporter, permease protein [Fibrobacter succinogenes subsp. succinogenes S85]|jgi:NitT/TauT family transport system permease protein|uniref:ABC transporter, permease protein n=1 Tax=Fibrobacter succinogenes (strain ATCC 19169 / S85) TaxID=59374 RepID=C9RQ24_FIBSS|nr:MULTISPECIES: ABC transporter permease subunit [Fibrobacter]MBQ5464922.1 ABC transporter permease subunit [Fibrobacter sp.]ACX74701.1 binding-protein-dependent transport systems inner membrane component [Fibrobacter succinogenes subsp. succinogenes S85]ADL26320.1 ABC transporter, permease protein [Fibrobacter succinogenes subsp. succinogenes S85]SHM22282.1 NitT/TauT family transport system permease protein [Fibrobacter sp. UWB7]SMG26120.1 NitT/TauT family transport system permease protein [